MTLQAIEEAVPTVDSRLPTAVDPDLIALRVSDPRTRREQHRRESLGRFFFMLKFALVAVPSARAAFTTEQQRGLPEAWWA
jgi:hypothetical protein